MRAVVFQEAGRASLEDVPRPALREPGDVIVRVTITAICGSDLHVLNGRIPGMLPGGVLGHEFIGLVEEVGAGVTRWKEGDRVLASFTIPCGACWFCARGLYNRCPDSRVFGYGIFLGDLDGAQAEYVRVPQADLVLRAVDDDMADEQALFAGDIMSTGYDCAAEARIEPGDAVLVQGCGPVGLFAVQAARAFAPGLLLAADTVPARLELAASFGAIPLDGRRVNIPTAVRELTGGRGADAVLECVGALPAFDQAIECARAGGRISVIGVYGEPEHAIPLATVFMKGIDVKFCGVANVLGRWDAVIDLIRAGGADPAAIITHRLSLSDALRGYELFASKEALKVVMVP